MSRPDKDREIADASFLFHDSQEAQAPVDPSRITPGSTESAAPASDLGGYDLADHPPPDRSPRRPAPIQEPGAPEIDRSPAGVARPEQLTPAPVLHPWTRFSEWRATLGRISLAMLIVIVVVYWTFSVEHMAVSLAILAVGLGVVILLSYPIAITLERPVRMTPEHAVRDFYGSLAHHVPHLRRMWLLLSSAGRNAPEFDSYSTFHAYWKQQINGLKRKGSGGITPLSVRIEEFKSDKSAGQEAVKASYRLSLFLRGREDKEPLHSVRVETTLSRGPDRMWYLDEGTLPSR